MKTLTKIKLINWHIFHDETISIKNNVLITGENGSGKSTFIDAIHYLLSGGTAHFNAAANTNSKRTLETYMRGKIGVEGQEFLRNSASVISHIALEFIDSEDQKPFVLGATFEIRDNSSKTNKTFYHIIDSYLLDDYYYRYEANKKQVVNFKTMNISIESSSKRINKIEGNSKEIRNAISQILRLENKKYFELLPKAMAFKPIDDVSQFVYDFLLPEENLNIEHIKTDIQSYRDVEKEVQKDEEKIDFLNEIKNLKENVDKLEIDKLYFKLLGLYTQLMNLSASIKKSEKSVQTLSSENSELDNISNQNDIERDSLKDQIATLKNSDSYVRMREIEAEITVLKTEIEKTKSDVNKTNEIILNEQTIINHFDMNINLRKVIQDHDFSMFKSNLADYNEKRILVEESLTNNLFINKNLIDQSEEEMKELKKEIEVIEKGLRKYPDSVEKLIFLIKEEAKNKLMQDIDVQPLCELVEVNDESWRNALEGYLNTRRFDVFVDRKYYDFALNIYEKYKKEYRIHAVGLVNSDKLGDYVVDEQSLAKKLNIHDPMASKYVSMLLGQIICVDSVDDLKKYESSITRTVMVYRNKASRQTKSEVWENPFLGIKSRELRRDDLKKKIISLEDKINHYKKLQGTVESNQRKIKSTKVLLLENSQNIWRLLEQRNSALSQKEEEKKSLTNEDIFTIETIIAGHEAMIKKIDDQKQQNARKKDLNSQQIGSLEEIIKRNRFALDEVQGEINQHHLNPIFNKYDFEDFSQKNSSLDHKDIIRKIGETETKQHKLENRVVSLQTNYCGKFNFDATPQYESLPLFIDELDRIKNRELIQYKEKAAKALENCNKSFQEDFISRIRSKIRSEKANINRLNKVLESKPFGFDNEIYQFVVSKSKEKEFADYYAIFDSEEEFNLTSLFSEQLSNKNYQLLIDLLNRLTKEGTTAKQEEELQKYTDYRRFMSYDIKITNNNNDVTYFSKTNKEKSGGETQTPFYVIIAASFEQLIKASSLNKSSACIVILDEAFNNMDESRIEAMMGYYSQLKIQLFIVVPPLRASTIRPYVDTTIGLAKNRNRVIVVTQQRIDDVI